MPSGMLPFTVAFDLKRLADSARYGMANYGATQYVAELYGRLRGADGLRIAPVAFAQPREACMATLETTVARMKADLGQDIAQSWQQRRASASANRALHLLDGIPRGRRLSEPVVRTLDRLVYERCPFPNASSWDVYHSPINPLPPAQWTGSALRVLSVMDVIHLTRPEWFRGGIPPVRHALDSVDVNRDYIICISEYTRRDVLSLLPIAEDRTCVVPLAATDTFERPRRDGALSRLKEEDVRPGKYILALGQYDPRKNLARLAAAFRGVRSKPEFADCTLVLVASQLNRKRLARLLRASGLPPSSFRILVDVDDATLAGLLACAAVFAYVPLYEGFGIPVLEAMKAECPVIVSNTSSLPEVAGDAGVYVNPTSVESIVEGLSQVLRDATLRDSIRAKGRRQAAAFSWEKTTTQTLEFYERILEANAPRHSRRTL